MRITVGLVEERVLTEREALLCVDANQMVGLEVHYFHKALSLFAYSFCSSFVVVACRTTS